MELEKVALEVGVSNKNHLVIAGPGAGKTELLAQRACYLLQTNTANYPRKILAISFKKDAAANLAERVEKRCGKSLAQRFISKTYDAFAKNLLDRFVNSLPEGYRPANQYEIAVQDRTQNDVRTAFDLAGLPPRHDITNSERNKLLNDALIENCLPIPLNLKGYSLVKRSWEILLIGQDNFNPCITFQMITRLAEFIVRSNPLIKKSLQHTYSHVFLDEFQDTTDLQYDLLKTCFSDSKATITAVGDNKQRIMIWARAKRNVFDAFTKEFVADEKTLIMNHRSAPRLVEIQKLLYNRLNESSAKIEISNKWSENEGQAYLWLFKNHIQEAILISEKINLYINEEGLKPTDICVLVKQLPDDYANFLIANLKSHGIKARNEGDFQDLLKEDCIKICIGSLYLALSNQAPNEWVYITEILKTLRGYDDSTQIERIFNLQQELKKFLESLVYKVSNAKDERNVLDVLWRIINFFDVQALKNLFPQYRRGSYLNSLLEKLAFNLWQEFLEEKTLIESIENIKGLNSVPIMTIHKSKGLEYHTVVFLGLEDSAFWNYRNQQEEDTCAFFVALSRAKERVVFTFCETRQIGTRNQRQYRHVINDFYEILRNSRVVEEVDFRNS